MRRLPRRPTRTDTLFPYTTFFRSAAGELAGEGVMGELPLNHFGAILADPPWRFRTWTETNQKKSASRHYDLMTLDQIKALPVASCAADDCALFMWCVNPMQIGRAHV